MKKILILFMFSSSLLAQNNNSWLPNKEISISLPNVGTSSNVLFNRAKYLDTVGQINRDQIMGTSLNECLKTNQQLAKNNAIMAELLLKKGE